MSTGKRDLGDGWFLVSALWLERGYRRRHVVLHAHYPSSDHYIVRFRERPFYRRK